MAGVDLRTTQELAGHKDISMTVRYAHLSPDHKLDAIDRLMTLRATEEPAIEIKLDYPARRSG
jgi:site-specific recombinase XerC